MKGDFSRHTFDGTADYSDVLFQQGRVVADADLNEQSAIVRHRAERTVEDLIGHCGAPIEDGGFAVEPGIAALATHALTATDFLVAGEDGVLLKVAGTSVTPIAVSGPARHLRGVHCIDQSNGLAVGDGGTLLKVTLGASPTATAITSGVTVHLRAVHLASASKAFAVGDDATILAISNPTTSPTVAPIPAPAGMTATLRGVHFVSETKGYAVGDRGTLLEIDTTSIEPAVRVIPMPPGLAPNFNAVRFSSTSAGLAVGDGGAIIAIAVSGSTVTPVSIDPGQGNKADLLAIAYESGGKAYAVGTQAMVLEIDGITVRRISPSQSITSFLANLNTVSFAGTNGVAVGRSNKVIALPGFTQVAGLVLPATSLVIKPGRIYVDGVSAEIASPATLLNQPDLPVARQLDPNKKYLVYLDVWDRLITHLQDPRLRDVALGGADTAARAQTLAQVKVMEVTGSVPNCKPNLQAWKEMVASASSRLRARVQPQAAGTTACEVAATAGYRRLENQFYRVEIHSKDSGGQTAFKWSRENGSVVFPVLEIKVDTTTRVTVRLGSRGRDGNLDLEIDDWVELLHKDLLLTGEPGLLMKYAADGNDPLEIVLEGPVPQATIDALKGMRGLHIRRWDHVASTDATGALNAAGAVQLTEGSWLNLEDGVQVFFEAGRSYRSGEYWQIPARTITGDIEWLDDDHGAPAALPPAGVAHHYCCLAVINVKPDRSIEKISDCRHLFPAVTQLINLLYVGGDGQEGLAGKPLARKLQVRVMNGGLPVLDATVRFTVESGGGTASSVTAEGNGVYSCTWILGGVGLPQAVVAELRDVADDVVLGQLIRFTATVTAESLEYVSGDGQEGVPGDTLEPLMVRVVDAAGMPVNNATVTFTAMGGGTVTPASVTTSSAGLAQTQWILGSGDYRQQVEAKLTAPPSVLEKKILFNANLSLASKVQYTPPQDCPDLAGKTDVQAAIDALCHRPAGGGSCCVTVGDGGEYPTISAAVDHLIKENKMDVCLCLMPGDHVLQSLDLKSRGIRLAISGCGVQTRVVTTKDVTNPELATHFTLPTVVTFSGFSSIEFSNLDVLALVPIVFVECGEVVLDRLTIGGVAVEKPEFQQFPLVLVASGRRVVLRDCHCSAFTVADLKAVVSLDKDISSISHEKPGMGRLFQKLRLREFSDYAQTLATVWIMLPPEGRKKLADGLAEAVENVKLPQAVKDGFNEVVEAILQAEEENKAEPYRIFAALLEIRALLGLHGAAGVLGISSRVTSIVLERNRIEGTVSLYGVPGTTTLEKNMTDSVRKLLSALPTGGSIELSGNTFGRLLAGNEVDEWLSKSRVINLKKTAQLWGNMFARTGNEMLVNSCSINSNSFACPGNKRIVGMTGMALKITGMGNTSLSWDANGGLSEFKCWKGTVSPAAKLHNDIQFIEQ